MRVYLSSSRSAAPERAAVERVRSGRGFFLVSLCVFWFFVRALRQRPRRVGVKAIRKHRSCVAGPLLGTMNANLIRKAMALRVVLCFFFHRSVGHSLALRHGDFLRVTDRRDGANGSLINATKRGTRRVFNLDLVNQFSRRPAFQPCGHINHSGRFVQLRRDFVDLDLFSKCVL